MKLKKLLTGFLAAAIAVSVTAFPASAVKIKVKKLSLDKIETAWNSEVDGAKIKFIGNESSAAGWISDPLDLSAYDEIAVKVENNTVDLSVSVEYSDGTTNASTTFSKSKGTVICPLNEDTKDSVRAIYVGKWGKAGSVTVLSASARESADTRKVLPIAYDGQPFELTKTAPTEDEPNGGIDGGRIVIDTRNFGIKLGETTLGELKKTYKSFNIDGFVYKNDSLGLGEDEIQYYMFIVTQNSKTDPSENFYGSSVAFVSSGGILWDLSGIDGKDSYIIKEIGVGINTGSKKINKLKTGEKITVNALAKKVSAPTEVKAVANSRWEIGISWKKTGAKSYNVFRSNSKNGYYRKIGTTKKTSYTDKDVTSGNTYYYKITSVNSNRDSGFSKVASAKASAPAPENLEAVKEKAGTAKLTWYETTSADGYTIFMSTSKDGKYKSVGDIAAKDSPSFTKKGLEKGKTYYFKVRSYYLDEKGEKVTGGTSDVVKVEM